VVDLRDSGQIIWIQERLINQDWSMTDIAGHFYAGKGAEGERFIVIEE
jgi:hypothetical protein